ncbi:coagulation factor V isoform X1 [Gadus macrocephalus]|uniref:coagulation factor V isoform X1 n=1 Tax=Gadus macrocephalus TaxID=80720 RepID=UPI0028CB67D2|nr:coagulation factor V isoform X1 [Gadus macrocephalus]
MRLCSWAGPQCFVPFLVLLAVLPHVTADQDNPKERHYYVAAVEIDWNYLGKDSRGNDSTYKKVVFREYERDFKQPKTHPTWLGLLGPTLRAQEGETIVVTFRNMADREYSLHPHGIAYGKQSEGAPYFDNTSLKEKEDDVVRPGGEHTYYWEVTSAVAPQKADPACLTYTYVSHLNVVKDYNSGLIGTLLLCKPGSLNEFGEQVHFPQEYVFLFGVFDEKESWFTPAGHSSSNHVMHTINGYAAGSLPDVDICAHSSVSLHLVGMSSEQELFSVHMNGQVLQHRGHKMSTVGLVSGSATTGSMRAVHPGRWLLSSQTNKHMEAGMHGFVDVRTCKGFEAHRRRLTIEQQRHSKEWTYYIAAEEIMWNYAPKMPAYIDEDFKVNYLDQGNHRIGGIYKKAVYTQYTDETFTVRSEEKQRKAEVGILGPVIRAQIRDVIKVVFKNMASKPYSIYPHGLTIEKSQEGATYPEGGNQTHAVQPGQTHHYEWKVVDEDEPLDTDARCLTYLYHSAVDTPRDIASGLIGPLLICKSQSLNVRNVQLKADKEQHAMFMVFDENKSWYLDDNIQSTCGGETVNKAEPGFYKSNVMHTINGYVFESGQLLGFCNGEIATWHVSSVGAQDYIQSVTFYGHTFNLNDRTEDILGLYPMTGETIFMNMDNIGVWLLATLNSHGSTKGMRVRFQDVECYRDYEYEYTDYNEPNKEFAVWKPATLAEIDKEDELKKKQEMEEKKEAVVDSYTDYYAGLLGLRSLKKQSSDSDVEQIDFSLLDFDAVDVPEQDSKTFSGIQTTTTKTDMEKSNIMKEPDSIPMSQNETLSAQQEIYKTNLTTYILNQSKSETATWMKNSSASIDTNVSRSKDNISTNHSMPTNLLPINSTFIPETAHAILNNTTIPLISGATNISMTSKTNVSYTFKAEGINSTQTMGNKTSERIIQTENILEVFSYVVPPQGPTSNGTNEMVRLDIEDQTGSALIGESEIERGGQQGPFGDGINATVLPEINASFINDTDTFYNVTQLTKDILSNVSEEAISEEMHNHTRRKVDRLVMNMTKPFGDGINATVLPEINASSINDTDTFYKLTQLTKDILSNVIEEAIGYAFFSKKKMHKPTKSMVEIKVEDTMNMTKTNDSMHTVTKTENRNQRYSFGNETIPENSIDDGLNFENDSNNVTKTLTSHNDKISTSIYHSAEQMSSNQSKSWDAFLDQFNSLKSFLNENLISGSPAQNSNQFPETSDVDLSDSVSSEEIVIYLQNHSSNAIRTSRLDPQGHNWTYDGTHQTVPLMIPYEHVKYHGYDAPLPEAQTTSTPIKKPKTKKVNLRQLPQKGRSMKTKKRKEFKPQPRSGPPVSPPGFNPGMSPRGMRPNGPQIQPVSSTEDLINIPVVIGVPRPDWSDYELYVPSDNRDNLIDLRDDSKQDEYEYVSYKDPYGSKDDMMSFTLDEVTKYYLKTVGKNVRTYFISAEEVEWDYAGYGQRRPEKTLQTRRETKFTKVVFREYLDSTFTTPILRGEMEEHLGILGPLIKAEVGQSIMVVFRNRASRPYSMHPNGVTYTKLTEGLSYEDDSKYWYKFDNEVQPNTTFTYLWEVREMAGPMPGESSCRTWAYYSGVNPERDLHSGLIGPLLVCRKDTLNTKLVDVREFVLLFMTFDESQSWYYEKNSEMRRRRKSRVGGRTLDPNLKEKLRFHSINGIIFSLKGLRLYTKQLACWHLINMGSPKDVHTVHFHGQTFTQMNTNSYRQAVYPLLPGGFATLEMWPSKPGLWQLDTEVGAIQQKGMQTLFLVLDNECSNPLGLESGSVKDSQITSNHVRGYWEPHLARLNKQGKYNAWSTDEDNSWIQVDFLRPVVISQVATQGAKQMFHSQYVVNYTISYSTDRRSWIFFKGDSPSFRKNFPGNNDANGVEKQILFPPLIGRYVRFHPNHWYKRATVRMEMYGCELDGCSVPLGMEGGLIKDHQITASSRATSWFGGPWNPSLARLNLQGTVNAWQALNADMNQWLQIELTEVKKITGIITQGAKSMGKEMYVVSFTLEYSEDGVRWTQYTDDEEYTSRRFIGNTDNNGPVRNYIYPPIFSRFIRVIPTSWKSSITMRMELLGCDFE